MKQTPQEFLQGLRTDIDVAYHVNLEDLDFEDPYQGVCDQLDNQGAFNIEVIYYSRAMEYLMENDASLNQSLEIAHELGYTTENLNSELLASLLASQNARIEFAELEDEINDFFSELVTE